MILEMANSESVIMEKKLEWTHEETVLLLNLYETSLENTGPMKQFKNKKQMWVFIGSELAKSGIERTGMQCENRYKTVYKRKRKNDELKSIIDSSREQYLKLRNSSIPSVAEIIVTEEDEPDNPSIQISHCYTDTSYAENPHEDSSSSSSAPPSPAPKSSQNNTKKRKRNKNEERDLCELLISLAKERERNKKARHDEKMELLRSFLKQE